MSEERDIHTHKVNGLNYELNVTCLDEAGLGGACHKYSIQYVGPNAGECKWDETLIHFQNGPIKEAGVNGISNEALIAILIDRMEGFQSGKFACHDNQMALDHLQGARLWLHKRTMDRVARDVEGTNKQ